MNDEIEYCIEIIPYTRQCPFPTPEEWKEALSRGACGNCSDCPYNPFLLHEIGN